MEQLRLPPAHGMWSPLEVVASTGSTNADLLAAAAAGAPEGQVLVAEEQTAGRGRLGRSWASLPGASLTFSVLLRPAPVPAARRGWLPLLAGLAVATAVRSTAGAGAVLKWPNDVLLGERKLAGILAEQSPEAAAVIVGIGLNAATPAGALPPPAAGGLAPTSLLAAGAAVPRAELLLAVLGQLERWYQAFRADPDPERSGLLDAYRPLCVTLGTAVRVSLPSGRSLTGTAAGLGAGGQLLVAASPGDPPVAVSAGDVVHVRPHGARVLPGLYDLPMTRVLLAEDDTSISEPLSRALRREGYQVEVTEDGPATLGRALSDGIDLILLDIGLPELDGLEVCRRVRAEGNGVPVLILTARADEVDTVVGLDAGADDYVTKPFRLAELLARVRALLRRGTAEVPGTVRGVRVDAEARRAWHGDAELDLTTKEFDLLWILLRDAGKVVTREQIMREVWDAKWWTSTKTLDMHISWLRRKLGDDAHHPRYITTVRGVGFRFERGD